MIAWTDQEPDFQVRGGEELLSRLSFSQAAALAIRPTLSYTVIIDDAVRQDIQQHLQAHAVEMGGLLLGSVHQAIAGEGMLIAIDGAVRATQAHGTSVSLKMDSQVWEEARAQCSDRQSVVGWYHSHPNLGAFFSGTDRYTQRAFFSNEHSIGLVIDPIRREEKWFRGVDCAEVADRDRLIANLGGTEGSS